MSMKSSKVRVAHWFFLIVGAALLFLFWKVIQPFALVLVTAGIVAVVLTPLDDRLRKLVKHPRLSAVLMLVAVFFILFIPLFSVGVLMVHQASDVAEASFGDDGWLQSFDLQTFPLFEFLPELVQEEILAIDLLELGSIAASWAFEHVGDVFSSGARFVFNTFIFFIALYYFLAERGKIYREALALSPFKDKLDAKIVDRIVRTVRGVVFGALVIAVVQGIIASIGMTIFGVPGALLWGSLVVIASQVPLLGVGLIMVPAVAYLFLTGSTGAAVGLAIWAVVVVGLVDNFLSPRIIGGRTNMHSLLVLIAILGGLQLFGPIGFIVGPTILAALLVAVELYKSGILEKA